MKLVLDTGVCIVSWWTFLFWSLHLCPQGFHSPSVFSVAISGDSHLHTIGSQPPARTWPYTDRPFPPECPCDRCSASLSPLVAMAPLSTPTFDVVSQGDKYLTVEEIERVTDEKHVFIAYVFEHQVYVTLCTQKSNKYQRKSNRMENMTKFHG